jgi:hypothetical protein
MADLAEPTHGLTRSELMTARRATRRPHVHRPALGPPAVLPRVKLRRHVRAHVEAAILTAETAVRRDETSVDDG